MTDDLTKRRPQDAEEINLNQSWERSEWTGKFGVSESVLKKAVDEVGPYVSDVEAWLKKNGY